MALAISDLARPTTVPHHAVNKISAQTSIFCINSAACGI